MLRRRQRGLLCLASMGSGLNDRCCSCGESLVTFTSCESCPDISQTAVTHFLGKGVAYFATALICLVIAGSALGNSFVAGRMTAAAANNNWFPHAFGTVGQIGPYKIKATSDASKTAAEAMDQGESPMYVLT